MKIAPSHVDLPLNKAARASAKAPMPATNFADQLAKEADSKKLRPLSEMEMLPGAKGPVKPLKELNPPPLPIMPLGEEAFGPGQARQPKSQTDRVNETARKWIAQSFYGPMFKQMRESPFKSQLFSGGRGGQAFSSMLDQRLAEHMARSADSKLVRSIARKFEGKSGQAKAPAAKAPAADNNPYQNVRIHVAPDLRA